jgi:hypothetical protein
MKQLHLTCLGTLVLALAANAATSNLKVVVEHNDNEHATAAFKFQNVPAPSKVDAATQAKFTIVDGAQDENGGNLDKLHDGKLPSEQDEPAENFFFNAGTEGGRILVDLGAARDVRQVNTYSWHPNTRGPQVYQLYASDGSGDSFKAQPAHGADPEKSGWTLLARVDTRPKTGEGGGQYGVSISDPDGTIGNYRYLLFDMARTEADDEFGNTFYSEIDVVAKDSAAAGVASGSGTNAAATPYIIRSPDGYCEITITTPGAPDLKEWAEQKLAPVLAEWYPKIVAMLPSEGYSAPKQFTVTISPGRGVAATGGTRVMANSTWLKGQLNREAVGALLHEEVHVIQQWRGGRGNPDYKRPPGWLQEGIPDYIRWFIYEPQSHGADVVYFRTRRNLTLNYDGLYRITANFLNYVVERYDPKKELITKLNAVCRQGKYTDDLWKEYTGKALTELNDEWKTATEKQLHPDAAAGS